MSTVRYHIRKHEPDSHRGYQSDVKANAVEAASLWLEWSGVDGSVSTATDRLLDGEQLVSERGGLVVVATPQPEYVAVDLDENNRHMNPEPTAFGWGVCRHGHGLQDLPPLTETQAQNLTAKLNRSEER